MKAVMRFAARTVWIDLMFVLFLSSHSAMGQLADRAAGPPKHKQSDHLRRTPKPPVSLPHSNNG